MTTASTPPPPRSTPPQEAGRGAPGDAPRESARRRRPPLGQILRQSGHLSPRDLALALALQNGRKLLLGEILTARRMVPEEAVLRALSIQHDVPLVDLERHPPDPELAGRTDPALCLAHRFIPWRRIGDITYVAVNDIAGFPELRPKLARLFPDPRPVLAPLSAIEGQLAALHAEALNARAEIRCPEPLSCRAWARPRDRNLTVAALLALLTLAISFPVPALWLLWGWVMLNLGAMTLLRTTALLQAARARLGAARPDGARLERARLEWARLGRAWLERLGWRGRRGHADEAAPPPQGGRDPRVSILVPLYREGGILPRLIRRLERLDYPRELLDVVLVLEAGDAETRAAVDATPLPGWMRVIEAPPARIRTKPRAMNYALDFCKGEIIGIYDAEDAPEPDQIRRVVACLESAPPEVACVQAYLDYYNPRENWLARCFTIEYATWFRLILQGVERMRLPVPLGGTSVFFRRRALVALGAWDAWNVTEDADLGMRLARAGYRCAFVSSTTFEEANCHILPWIRQRSRWLKGYAMTWVTHMLNPLALWRDLGPAGFVTFQVLLLGTLSNFLLAPVIWSFWLVSFGVQPAFYPLLPGWAWGVLAWSFVGAEAVQMLCNAVACWAKPRRHLLPFVPTMLFYWPLGTLAVAKAMWELLVEPFYWDKTRHGKSAVERSGAVGIDAGPPPDGA